MIFPSYVKQRKKQKILITTLSLFITLILVQHFYFFLVQFISDWILLSLLIILQAILTGWVLDFDLRPTEIVFFLVPASLLISINYLFLKALGMPLGYLMVILLMTVFYVLLSVLNVINVATVRPVPLKQAAVSALFCIGLIMFFLFGWLVFPLGWGINEYLFWFWLAVSLFGTSFLFLASEGSKIRLLEMVIYSFLVLKILILINFWPASRLTMVIATTGWLFIVLGIFHYHLNKNLKKLFIRESLMISLLLAGIFLWL